MAQVHKEDEKHRNMMMILGAVALLAILIGGFLYYQNSQGKTVSMNIGDKEIGATMR